MFWASTATTSGSPSGPKGPEGPLITSPEEHPDVASRKKTPREPRLMSLSFSRRFLRGNGDWSHVRPGHVPDAPAKYVDPLLAGGGRLSRLAERREQLRRRLGRLLGEAVLAATAGFFVFVLALYGGSSGAGSHGDSSGWTAVLSVTRNALSTALDGRRSAS